MDHNGEILVESEVGVGTTFLILLPGTKQLTEQVKEISPTITGVGTILLVDDEEINRILIKDILESLGYKVLLAVDGQESIGIFSKKHSEIDIVLMDMIMPRMNGSEAFYKMKEIDENCKVIISSGNTKDENTDELIKNGLVGFINKPYRISEISQVLKNGMNREN
ncbi:MAG: response regulator [Spirochaetaceae bacterium]|nr:response regulator [Spirochaetaceae bacterium]